jgi:hypothetical protein
MEGLCRRFRRKLTGKATKVLLYDSLVHGSTTTNTLPVVVRDARKVVKEL